MRNNNQSFLIGSVVTTLVIAMTQDVMGKEKYIELVNTNWLEAPWFVWIPPILMLIALHTKIVAKEIKSADKESRKQ